MLGGMGRLNRGHAEPQAPPEGAPERRRAASERFRAALEAHQRSQVETANDNRSVLQQEIEAYLGRTDLTERQLTELEQMVNLFVSNVTEVDDRKAA